MKQHVLILLDSKKINPETKEEEFMQLLVNDDILSFLNNFSNIEKNNNGSNIYIINRLRLLYNGVVEKKEESKDSNKEDITK